MPEQLKLSDFTSEKLNKLQEEIKSNFARRRRLRGGPDMTPSIVNSILKQANFILHKKNGLSDQEGYAYLLLFMKSIHDMVCNSSLSLFPTLSLDKKAFKVLSTTLLDKPSSGSMPELKSVNEALKEVVMKFGKYR
jgi:hypothetical protein